jgi:hypothetical protein
MGHRTEHLRREFAQQILGRAVEQWLFHGSSLCLLPMLRATSRCYLWPVQSRVQQSGGLPKRGPRSRLSYCSTEPAIHSA